jgi:tetratricopeptide (TPR) repeat protein
MNYNIKEYTLTLAREFLRRGIPLTGFDSYDGGGSCGYIIEFEKRDDLEAYCREFAGGTLNCWIERYNKTQENISIEMAPFVFKFISPTAENTEPKARNASGRRWDPKVVAQEEAGALARKRWLEEERAKRVAIAEAGLKKAEENFGPDHPETATWLNALAEQYYATASPAKAEPLYRRGLEILEKSLSPEHPHLATCLNNLAILLHGTNDRYAQAEPLYKRSLAILEKTLDPAHPILAKSLTNLAYLYRRCGRQPEAEELENRAATIRAAQVMAGSPS